MKLALSSTAVAKTSHFPVGITGAIVSKLETMLAARSCESVRENSTRFQTGLPSETAGEL